MAKIKKKLIRECKRQFNHIGIYGGFEICRLIGFAEDEYDYYYHVMDIEGNEKYNSMVGGFYSIKRMGKRGYEYTERNIITTCPRAKKFMVTELDMLGW